MQWYINETDLYVSAEKLKLYVNMSGSASFNPSYEVAPMRQPLGKSKGEWDSDGVIWAKFV